jgi:hypothetical protein
MGARSGVSKGASVHRSAVRSVGGGLGAWGRAPERRRGPRCMEVGVGVSRGASAHGSGRRGIEGGTEPSEGAAEAFEGGVHAPGGHSERCEMGLGAWKPGSKRSRPPSVHRSAARSVRSPTRCAEARHEAFEVGFEVPTRVSTLRAGTPSAAKWGSEHGSPVRSVRGHLRCTEARCGVPKPHTKRSASLPAHGATARALGEGGAAVRAVIRRGTSAVGQPDFQRDGCHGVRSIPVAAPRAPAVA